MSHLSRAVKILALLFVGAFCFYYSGDTTTQNSNYAIQTELLIRSDIQSVRYIEEVLGLRQPDFQSF